jgi:ammonia channel protein AmtB
MAGAVAERMTLIVYLGYTCLMTTIVSTGRG